MFYTSGYYSQPITRLWECGVKTLTPHNVPPCSSYILVAKSKTAWYHSTQDRFLSTHCHENLKVYYQYTRLKKKSLYFCLAVSLCQRTVGQRVLCGTELSVTRLNTAHYFPRFSNYMENLNPANFPLQRPAKQEQKHTPADTNRSDFWVSLHRCWI